MARMNSASGKNRVRISCRHKVLFSLAAFFCFVILAEMALRLTGLAKAPAERYYTDIFEAAYELLPGVRVPFGNHDLPDDPTNHAGFRGPEFADRKPAGAYRIISVGDSTAFGVLVPEPQTFPRLLETKLRAASSQPVEVLNAGIPGTTIYSHRLLFERKLRNYRPDLVILYVLFNSDPNIEILRQLEKKHDEGRDNLLVRLQSGLRDLKLYRLLRREIKGSERAMIASQIQTTRTRLGDFSVEAAWCRDGFREDLENIARDAREAGVKLLLVYHLTQIILDARLDQEKDPSREIMPSERLYDSFRDLTADFCQKKNLLFLDLLPAFLAAEREGKKLFVDPVHFNGNGHSLAAEELTKLILNNSDQLQFSRRETAKAN